MTTKDLPGTRKVAGAQDPGSPGRDESSVSVYGEWASPGCDCEGSQPPRAIWRMGIEKKTIAR